MFTMQTFPSLQLIFLFVIITRYSLAERTLGTQAGEKVIGDWTLSKPALTQDEFEGFAPQMPIYETIDSMSFNQETAPNLQTSNCNPQGPNHASKNRRAKRSERPIMCDRNPFANEGKKGRAPARASDLNEDVPEKDENIEHKSDETIQTEPLFPLKEDTAVCKDPDFPIPVCGRLEARKYPYIKEFGRNVLIIDPANPFITWSCPPLQDPFCCNRVIVEYGVARDEPYIARPYPSLPELTDLEGAVFLVDNPFKYVGIWCQLMPRVKQPDF